MKPFDYYYDSVDNGSFYYTNDSYVVQVSSNPISYDDIAEEFSYNIFSDYTSDLRTVTLSSRDIAYSFNEKSIEAIQQNYPELFI